MVRRIVARRDLTALEWDTVRRQKRLVRNREEARLSRQRKKQYVQQLEEENEDLREQLRLMKERYARLMVVPSPSVSFTFPLMPSPPMPLDCYADGEECDFFK